MSTSPAVPNGWRPPHRMDPDRTYRFRVPIHELQAPVTPNEQLFVLAHFGVPRIRLEDWRLEIAGKVRRPCALDFDALKRFRKYDVESFLKCAGFPDNATINTHNASNAIWSGADLGEVLDHVGVDPKTSFIWSYGADHGTYADWSAEEYVKDVPMPRVRERRVLLAYEVNGEPLPAEHGFPVRLFVPGFYGTNSVKWLCRIEAADTRAPGILTSLLYNDSERLPDGSMTNTPVWSAPPDSIIVHPRNDDRLAPGVLHVQGWAWADDGISSVEISLDDGQTWSNAQVGIRRQHSWQAFEWTTHRNCAGEATIVARARDAAGRIQPLGSARNSSHRVRVRFEHGESHPPAANRESR